MGPRARGPVGAWMGPWARGWARGPVDGPVVWPVGGPAGRPCNTSGRFSIFDDDGANPIQAEERRGGDGRNLNQQMVQAARTFARLALLMGLEPTTGAMQVFQLMNVHLVFQLALVHQKIMMVITQGWST